MNKHHSAALSVAATLVILGCTATSVTAQDTSVRSARVAAVAEGQPVTMLGAQRYAVAARNVDQTYQIDVLPVVSPLRPPAPGEKLPVVFVLDGNLYFPMVASTATLLSLDTLPSMLIVGIGYDFDRALAAGGSMMDLQARRNRDYTPSVDEVFLLRMKEMYGRFGSTYPNYGRLGGADAFLAFINDELKPFITERYPNADTEDSTIVGDSFGGLFALHVLFTAPDSFDRYIAASPSPWWGEGALFAAEADAMDDVEARLFMSMGDLESEDEMRVPLLRMDALLRDGRWANLAYTFRVFGGETHSSVVPAAFGRGLREVFR